MKEIIAYEMVFRGRSSANVDIVCVPFDKKYWNDYMEMYNDCFFEMRKELDVKPYNFYSDYSQIADKVNNVFVYIQNEQLIGAVFMLRE